MASPRIEQALASAQDTKDVLIGDDAILAVPELFRSRFGSQRAIVIADENTYQAAGDRVRDSLHGAGVPAGEPWVLPADPPVYADYKTVTEVTKRLQETEGIPVVVGSGTLNDIVKLASHRAGRRYIVVATAASMDGYTAFGASIARDGYKQTFSCPAPVAVVAETAVVRSAPPAMTASGYADLLGKITAGADWLLADAVGTEAVYAPAWHLVQDSLRDWVSDPARLRDGDGDRISQLTEGLILTGLAMQAHRNSRPASGSEHQFSHLWEMEHLSVEGMWLSHGFKVGVGSIAVAAMYETFLSQDLASIDIERIIAERPDRGTLATSIADQHTIPILKTKAVEESLAKYAEDGELRRRLSVLQTRWPAIRDRLNDQLMGAAEISALLSEAGCPVDPLEIGVERGRLQRSYAGAQQIRKRYTMLDTAVETDTFAASVEPLFADRGFWSDLR